VIYDIEPADLDMLTQEVEVRATTRDGRLLIGRGVTDYGPLSSRYVGLRGAGTLVAA